MTEKTNKILLTAAILACTAYFITSTVVKFVEHGLTKKLYNTTLQQDSVKFVQDSIYNAKSIEFKNKQIETWR